MMSPNYGPRPAGMMPDLVVLHYTAMESCMAAKTRLCDPKAEVSAHYLIGAGGDVHRLVTEDKRAWHAGAGSWGACRNVNDRSIGIELDNQGNCPFPERQMAALEEVLADILARFAIPPRRVIAHSDMAPLRKIDPGPRFDWRRLARQGLSIWPQRGEVGDFGADARRFGYGDAPEAALLAAFRLRFRPWASGALDDTDRALMGDLAARFPVDGPWVGSYG